MEVIRRAADLKCSGNIQLTVEIVDSLLVNPITRRPIKALFGLADLEHDEDFVSLLEVCPHTFLTSGICLLTYRFSMMIEPARQLAGSQLGPGGGHDRLG